MLSFELKIFTCCSLTYFLSGLLVSGLRRTNVKGVKVEMGRSVTNGCCETVVRCSLLGCTVVSWFLIGRLSTSQSEFITSKSYLLFS